MSGPNNPAAFVGALADAVAGEAEKAITWYLDKKDGQRRLSRAFRVAAIVLIMAATLLPILGEIFKPDGKPPIWLSPGWASVTLVLAATLLVLDRFYGWDAVHGHRDANPRGTTCVPHGLSDPAHRLAWRQAEPEASAGRD